MNVTRAVLPVMREQRSGKVVSISSTAEVVGQAFCSAYAASKFGLEGWMESLRFEVELFGIRTTAPRPVFLVYAVPVGGKGYRQPLYYAAAGAPKEIWRAPGSGHTGGLEAQPAEYERRVVEFFDAALLGSR